MLILLFGPDDYRSREKLNEIIEHYKELHKKGLSFTIFDCESLDFSDFKNETGTVSMFGDKKLIVVKNAFASLNFKTEFLKKSKDFINSKDIVVFYEDGKIAANDSLLKLLKKEAKCQEFEILVSLKLKTWVKKEFEKYQVKVSPVVLEKFFFLGGGNLWQTANDIKKLATFKLGEGAEITPADFDKLIKLETENDIFKTIEAVSSKNRQTALKLIHSYLEQGETVPYLLSMINYQFRTVSLVKDSLQRGLPCKLHPFVVRKSLEIAKKFSFPEIKKIYQKIFQADLDIKTGKAEPETALDMLITSI